MQSYKNLFVLSLLLNLALIGSIAYIIHRLGGLKYMIHRVNNRDISGIYEHRKEFFNMLPKQKGGIVFLGDSITEYGQWEEFTQHPKVINRGIAGDTTPNLLKRLDHIIELAPTKIFLMIGINDFLFFNRHDIIKNYQKIVDRLHIGLPNTQVYVQSILPINPTIRRIVVDNEEVRLLNKDIQQLAKGKQFTYIDLHNLLKDANGNLDARYTLDGIHLKGAAYQIWKREIEDFLKE